MATPSLDVDRLDWAMIAAQLDIEGYAMLPALITPDRAAMVRSQIDECDDMLPASLAQARLGSGELFYFHDPLPAPIAAWRQDLYRCLVPIANEWNDRLQVAYRYPDTLDAFMAQNRKAGQTRMLSRLSRLRVGDYLALHQLNAGAHVFPLQVVALLSETGRHFTGGEFVMTEQRPRMQSRPMVLPLKLGDMAIITTAQRPLKGAKGYYRVNLKHAISRVRSGERIGMDLSFHDAPAV
ncbi:MAG TPA: 2OG-Fe(II) oxygenase [Burkholderiaceae bacterium]|nr:2OG-Fe(II) oxygenase [Burkholderiaceae bacterium]